MMVVNPCEEGGREGERKGKKEGVSGWMREGGREGESDVYSR